MTVTSRSMTSGKYIVTFQQVQILLNKISIATLLSMPAEGGSDRALKLLVSDYKCKIYSVSRLNWSGTIRLVGLPGQSWSIP
jgi:hypothetical protein